MNELCASIVTVWIARVNIRLSRRTKSTYTTTISTYTLYISSPRLAEVA